MVYFLEFIEKHQELHELYETPLKDLFGINTDELEKYFAEKNGVKLELEKTGVRMRRHEVWHWSLFVRFLSASLLNRIESKKEFDFRIALAYVMIFHAIEAMRSRIISSDNPEAYDELKLFNSNVSNTELWSKLLASRYNEKKEMHSLHILTF